MVQLCSRCKEIVDGMKYCRPETYVSRIGEDKCARCAVTLPGRCPS